MIRPECVSLFAVLLNVPDRYQTLFHEHADEHESAAGLRCSVTGEVAVIFSKIAANANMVRDDPFGSGIDRMQVLLF